jgi:hypothetical protein
MAEIWDLCLRGKKIAKARWFAESIDEGAYFENTMRPKYFPYAGPLTDRTPDFLII